MHDSLIAVAVAANNADEAEAALRRAVARAREDGATWVEVAEVLGVTKQSAWQRFVDDAGRRHATQQHPLPTRGERRRAG